jgi:HK97 gp10 family phage protein
MATRLRIDTKGFEAYLERVALAGLSVDDAARRAVMAGAEVAKEGMRKRVPVDTGNLQEHIDFTDPELEGNTVFVLVGVIEADADTARYGTAQEYGSSNMVAQPYVRPTMDHDAARIKAAMRAALEAEGLLDR